jgi:aspartyl-tRNA(Asn)/glutamyl-tRNA(Gln) amidotransferase subunit B
MEYEIVIGLEVHAELATKSKIFCSCPTTFGNEVNKNTCPICLGMPGTLPVLNKKVVEYAVLAGLSIDCEISRYSKLDRKNYFYPDLPKAYQISQYDLPLCMKGHLDIEADGCTKRIGITRIHIEEDAGKLIHDENKNNSKIDYNRCGVPLIEIVSEPDMRSSKEAKSFVENLKSILEYIKVSDCKMQEGSLRADINLSVRPFGQKEFGTRTEMKNLNSLRAIERAIEYESQRQINEIKNGRKIIQETRRWDDDFGESYSMRSKEDAHDYRYFPDPDLVPIILEESQIQGWKDSLPELPAQRIKRYTNEYALPQYDATIITNSKVLADFFDEVVGLGSNPKSVSNWIMGELLKILKDSGQEDIEIPFRAEYLAKLIKLVDSGKINGTIAKKVFAKIFETNKDPEVIVKEEGLESVSDESELIAIVKEILRSNPQSVLDYKSGKEKAFGFLVGQAMRQTKGKADPQIINKLLLEELNK